MRLPWLFFKLLFTWLNGHVNVLRDQLETARLKREIAARLGSMPPVEREKLIHEFIDELPHTLGLDQTKSPRSKR